MEPFVGIFVFTLLHHCFRRKYMKKLYCLAVSIFIIGIFALNAEVEPKEMSLNEAISLALKNNLDLQVEIQTAEYNRNSLKINKAIFIPTLSLTTQSSSTKTPSTDFLSGAEVSEVERESLNMVLSQRVPLGGTFDIQLFAFKQDSNSIWNDVNPYLATELRFTLNQPLLKGFGSLATKRDIIIAANSLKMSHLDLKAQVSDLIYNVESAYWNLVYAHKNLETVKKSLQRAKDLLRQNEIRVEVGTAARIDILEAKAEVASNESQMIQAEQGIQTAEENLKKILNMSKMDQTLVPSDTPKVTEMTTDLNGFLMEALKNRPDIQRAKLDLKNYNVRVKYARNQMLPDLQLQASYYTSGRGGDRLIRAASDNPFERGEIIEIIAKTIWETLEDNISNKYKNYSISLNLQIPLSFSREKALLAQAKIDLKRSLLNLKNVENTIYSEVKEVIKEKETNLKLVNSTRVALELEEQKLKAEEKKLSVGLSTNFIVLEYQRQYAAAESDALQSLINYNMTISKINRILFRTFDAYNIKFKDFIR
jgi:outer membrane protein TolC